MVNDNVWFPSLAILSGLFIGIVSVFAPTQEAMLAGLGFGGSFVTGGFASFQVLVKQSDNTTDEDDEDI